MEDRDDRKKQGKSPDVLFAFFSLFPLTLDILIGGDGFAAPATRTPGGFQLSPNDSDSSELFVHGFCNSPHGDMQSDKISPHILQISNGLRRTAVNNTGSAANLSSFAHCAWQMVHDLIRLSGRRSFHLNVELFKSYEDPQLRRRS